MKLLTLALATALALSACANSSNPDNTNPNVIPDVGSAFTFNTYDTDTNGALVPGSELVHVDSVVAKGISFDDETDVWVIKGSNADSSFLTYDKYNDVVIRGSGWDSWYDQIWIRLPISSGRPSSLANTDRLIKNGVVTETLRKVSAERIAEEQVTVAGANIRTIKAKITVSRVVKQDGAVTSDYSTFHYYWFAPSLGTTIRIETPSQTIFGKKLNGAIEMLTGYTLK